MYIIRLHCIRLLLLFTLKCMWTCAINSVCATPPIIYYCIDNILLNSFLIVIVIRHG